MPSLDSEELLTLITKKTSAAPESEKPAAAAQGTKRKLESKTSPSKSGNLEDTKVSPTKGQPRGGAGKGKGGSREDSGSDGEGENDEDDDGDFKPLKKKARTEPPRKAREGTTAARRASSTAPDASTPATVPCPICQKSVKMTEINEHMDSGCTTHVLFPTPPPPVSSRHVDVVDEPAGPSTQTTAPFFSTSGLKGPNPSLLKNIPSLSLEASESGFLRPLLERPP